MDKPLEVRRRELSAAGRLGKLTVRPDSGKVPVPRLSTMCLGETRNTTVQGCVCLVGALVEYLQCSAAKPQALDSGHGRQDAPKLSNQAASVITYLTRREKAPSTFRSFASLHRAKRQPHDLSRTHCSRLPPRRRRIGKEAGIVREDASMKKREIRAYHYGEQGDD